MSIYNGEEDATYKKCLIFEKSLSRAKHLHIKAPARNENVSTENTLETVATSV